MYYIAPVRRMVNYGQSETATFNPEDPIGFKAFYDNALKDISYRKLLNLLLRVERNAPIWPVMSYDSGPAADFRAAGINVAKSVPKDANSEQLMLVPYILALITYSYMQAVSKITLSNVWKFKIQRYFDSEDVKIFLTYAYPDFIINSPFGLGFAADAIGNLSIVPKDVVKPIKAFAQLLDQFFNEQKSSLFTDADLYPNLKTAAFNPLDTPTKLPNLAPRTAAVQPKAPTVVVTKPKINWPLIAAIFGAVYFMTQRKN